MPTMRVQCPTCHETLEVDSSHAGQEVECGSCFATFVLRKPSLFQDDEPDEEHRPVRRRSQVQDDDRYEDDEDYPRRRRVRRRPDTANNNTAAVVSLILGILSMPSACCCVLISIPLSIGAIISGAIGMKGEHGKGMGLAGVICGVLGLLLSIAGFIVGFGVNLMNRL